MIYSLNGDGLLSVHDVSGQQLAQAYDLNGNPMMDEGESITVMTYNVQWFTKINGQQTMQNAIIAKYNPDIIGFQEFSRVQSIPSVGANMLTDYPHITLSNHYNFNAIASKQSAFDIASADYSAQSNEARSYIKAYFMYGNKKVCWINTHLEYNNDAVQYAQAAELLAMAEEEDYVIITGDFNSYGLSVESADYIGVFKPFVDAGYNLANSTAQRGFTKTWTSNTSGTSTEDLTYPCDNIVTSSNIAIKKVTFDETKFDYLDGNPIDHIPVVAELIIN